MKEKRNTFTTLFFLRKDRLNSKGEAPIYIRITVNRNKIAMATHRFTNPNDWNIKAGISEGSDKTSKQLNKYLFSVKSSIYELHKQLREKNIELMPIQIKNAYLGIEEDNRIGIIKVFEEHNNDIRKLEGIDYTSITIGRYETSLNRLKGYIYEKYGQEDYYIEDINHSFITGYEIYIKAKINLSHNTAVKYMKQLKKVVTIALSNGWISADPFAKIKIREKKVNRGYLTEEELKTLINIKFDFKRLEEVRDCFIFSCFTGLAHADLSRLTNENLVIGTDGGEWIKINRKKNDNLSSIPILPVTKQLILKYKNNPYCVSKNVLLPVKSNQKMNAYLKEIGVLSKIKKDLTTHLARHTFATTVTLNNDVPIETVSKMLGHNSLTTTKIYARLLDNKVGKDMSKINSIYSL